jgi:16S rRNA C1402 (ribose-2'-O) methylase RsmI
VQDPTPPGALLLAPGHPGNPADLSIRVVAALREARVLVVEEGAEAALARTLQALKLECPAMALLPSSGEVPESSRDIILTSLDRGGAVVLFGVEEGIPGYADPGAEVVRLVRSLRPAVAIRSLGGTSVIGAALLASGLGVDRVTLLGVTTMDARGRERKIAEVRRWVTRLARAAHAVAVLAPGSDVRAIAALLARVSWLDLHLTVCASLTLPGERVVVGSPVEVLATPLADDAPAVVFATASLRPWHPRSWWAAVSRLWL